MSTTSTDKPNPKPRVRSLYDYERKDKGQRSAQQLAAEYAELRTRTPNGRG